MTALIIGINDLATTAPALVLDWDYEKNGELLPTSIKAGSNKKIWWKCHVCNHSWQVSPNARTYSGRGCPRCSAIRRSQSYRRACLRIGENDLMSQAPDVAAEWDYDNNKDKTPAEFTIGSKEKVWWKCKVCGYQWQATINNRVNKQSGCPKCKKYNRTSFPEQAIFYYLHKIFPDAENSYAKFGDKSSMELDVYVPELRAGVEYDGAAWHDNEKARGRDRQKYLECQKHGIMLYRVSEFNREIGRDCDALILRRERTDNGLNSAIQELLKKLADRDLDIDVERDRAVIMKQYITYIANKSIAIKYPSDAIYWDIEMNKGLTPEMVNATSNVDYWWRCDLGHHYKAAPVNRLGTGNGCPYCSGKRVLEGFNDLQTKYPQIAKEWDYELNAPLLPTQVTSGMQKRVWWRCEKGHSYQYTILNRVYVRIACPYCSGHEIMEGFNDLATTNPEILKEWDYEKNVEFSPQKISKTSIQKVWWKCKKGHSWRVTVYSRVMGTGCPYCSNRYAMSGYNDLLTKCPEMAKEWDYEKNGELRPECVVAGSGQKVWWKCSNGHSWNATVASRVTRNSGCPYCANQKFKSEYNDIKTMYPELAKEWNVEKNNGVLPENVIAGGTKKVWWHCSKGHEWQAALYSRISGRGCPYCSNKKLLSGYNDFATVYPEFVHEWNYEKNGELKPDSISCGSVTKIWWKCSKGHEWYESPNQRRRSDGSFSQCIYCAGKKAIPGESDLATVRPDLIREWNYERNSVQPSEVKPFSAKKVWWRCSNCGLEWQAQVSNRSNGSGCPICRKSKGKSKDLSEHRDKTK